MADTPRSWTDLQALLADNTVQGISPQDLRDAFESFRAHGHLYIDGNASAQALTTSFAVLANMTAAEYQGTTLDATTAKITVTAAGVYLVGYHFSADAASGTQVTAGVFLNGSASEVSGSLLENQHSTDPLNSAATFIETFAASDYIQLMVKAGGSVNVTFGNGSFWAKRIA